MALFFATSITNYCIAGGSDDWISGALRRERVVGGRRVRAFGERARREEGPRLADAAMALGAAALACRWRKRA